MVIKITGLWLNSKTLIITKFTRLMELSNWKTPSIVEKMFNFNYYVTVGSIS